MSSEDGGRLGQEPGGSVAPAGLDHPAGPSTGGVETGEAPVADALRGLTATTELVSGPASTYLRVYLWVAVGILTAMVVAAWWVGGDARAWASIVDRLAAWGRRPGAPLLLLAAYYVSSLAGVMGLPMLGVMVACLGTVTGPLVALTGTAASAATVYVMARRLGRPYVVALYPDQVAKLQRVLVERPALRVVQMRLISAIPFHLVNGVCGVAGLPFGLFVVATVVGVTPRMLVHLYFVRAFLAGLTQPGRIFLVNFAVGLLLFCLVTVLGILQARWLALTDVAQGPRSTST